MTTAKRDFGLRCRICGHYVPKDGFGLLVVDGGRVTLPLCRECSRGLLANARLLMAELSR